MDQENYEFGYTDQEFKIFCNLIYEHTGIKMDNSKRDLVYSRLCRRLRDKHINNFEEYRCIVEAGNDRHEIEEFINCVTTNLTSFYRQDSHFVYLAEVLKEMISQGKRRIRIWSSAASTGEEPYTIAYTVQEAIPNLSKYDIKILATDIDSEVLETAREGIYTADKFRNVPQKFIDNAFYKENNSPNGAVVVRPEIKKLVTFRKLNLMDDWPVHGPFDVIFCRNVIIYFDKETQKKLFSRFAKLQNSGDYMMIGASENLFRVCPDYKLIEKAVYRKV